MSETNWKVFGLGGAWEGPALDETEALQKARAAGVLVVSWVRRNWEEEDPRKELTELEKLHRAIDTGKGVGISESEG